MATIWTGAIAFGLVNIPVKVEAAVRSHDLSFRMLHQRGPKDLCPIEYQRVCKRDGEEVEWEEIVKGYEYQKDRFVVLEEEDFEKAALATSKTFEIEDFAPEDQVDPRFFEKPYYLIPQRGGEKGYALLREAMKKTGTLGIGTITMRKKQYLASIKPIDDAIVLDLMRFADEVLEPTEYKFPGTSNLREAELTMAEQLVTHLTTAFKPEKYKDEYKENLEKIIAAKMKGRKINLAEAEEPDMTGVIDLMARLEESLQMGKKGSAKSSSTRKASTRKAGSKSSRTRASSARASSTRSTAAKRTAKASTAKSSRASTSTRKRKTA
jgi:DNA end-binding protein Ku